MESLHQKNLNLLPTLIAIADDLNLSRTAERLRVTQPALSHALQKLRIEFGDPLFVRSSTGLIATSRCVELIKRTRNVLENASGLYRILTPDIAKIERTLTIASTTYFEQRAITQLLRRAAKEAPLIKFDFRPLSGELPKKELESGEYDIAIAAYFRQLPDGMRQRIIATDDFSCVTRKKHPYLSSKRKLESYLSFQHLAIAVPPGSEQPVDLALRQKEKRRDIGLSISNFLTPPLALLCSDLILTCPTALAELYASQHALAIAPCPIELAPLQVQAIWHERFHHDALHHWLRETLHSTSTIP